LNYGFAVEDNRELDGFCPNEVPLEVGVNREDPLYSQKMEFWTRGESSLAAAVAMVSSRTPQAMATAVEASLAPMKRVRVCIGNNENTRLLFSLLRALACNEEELASMASTAHSGPHYDSRNIPFYRSCRDIRHPICIRNEREAMTLLLELTTRALSAYSTTLSQDIADLQDLTAWPRFSNERHAKIQVRGEKYVLHHFLRWARTALEVMNVIDEELKVERGEYLFDEGRVSFEYLVGEMEEDDALDGLHHTIVRYCADVLGSMRREELKALKRKKAVASSIM
jgi:Rubisco LSMT substrate-binding